MNTSSDPSPSYEPASPDVPRVSEGAPVLPESELLNSIQTDRPLTSNEPPATLLSSRRAFLTTAAVGALTFSWGMGAGFWLWGRKPPAPAPVVEVVVTATPMPTIAPPQARLPHSYTLPIQYGQLGPHLIRAGAFAYDDFVEVYDQAGQPLTEEQRTILQTGSDMPVSFDHANAYFLLNFFWALGLVNNNPILRTGPIMTRSQGQVAGFASTGGWRLATRPVNQLISSAALVTLTESQQARLEEAVAAIYRPCCDNPTSFPDCNHGMAMLGLLQLIAAQDATVEELWETAKVVNSFWYPAQSEELALYYQAHDRLDFAEIPAREAVGRERFSGTGFAQVHEWLAANGKLEAPSQNGSSCGV